MTLAPPDDALLRAVLVKLFADRQLAVDESLIGYLLAPRIERSFAAAREAVARSTRRRCAAAAGEPGAGGGVVPRSWSGGLNVTALCIVQ